MPAAPPALRTMTALHLPGERFAGRRGAHDGTRPRMIGTPWTRRRATRRVTLRDSRLLATALTLGAATACAGAASSASMASRPPVPAGAVAPVASGALVIAGGGPLGPEIMGRFIQLAGGADAPIVVIPTAGEDSVYPADWRGLDLLRRAGARNVTLRHTKLRTVAESDSFVAALRAARGVWFPGGRQWRLVDSYLGTRTERELHALLARGGVIGGTSAGASIQASYLVRGAREGNTIMMAPGYEQGFAFLRGVAVDQHVGARKRENDLQQVVARFPQLLGLGIDEATAIVVRGTRAEVVGKGLLYVHNGNEPPAAGLAYFTLAAGEALDLSTRRRVAAAATGSR